MATESAVTLAHAHPYTAGEDFCLVHNGSLSNHHMLRRMLERRPRVIERDEPDARCSGDAPGCILRHGLVDPAALKLIGPEEAISFLSSASSFEVSVTVLPGSSLAVAVRGAMPAQ